MPEPSITPLARQLAEENGIDWRQVMGSGPGGTIEEDDILDYLVRVMAGEVNLPPDPNEPVSSGRLAGDLEQIQVAMAREGIDIQNLVPPLRDSSEPAQDDLEFEVDFSNFEEEETPDAGPWENEPVAPDEGIWFTEPTSPAQASIMPEAAQPSTSSEEPSWISNAGPAWISEEETIATGSAFDAGFEEPIISRGKEIVAEEESSWVGGDETYFPEPEIQIGPRPEPEAPATPIPAPSLGSAATVLTPTGFSGENLAVFRRSVDLSSAQKAVRDLGQAWGEEVTAELFLFRAALQALAELEIPLPGVRGRLEANQVHAYEVKSRGNLKETWNRLKSAHQTGEGLWIFYLFGTPYDDVTIPGKPTLALGPLRIAGAENTGLLSLSGPVPTNSQILLERISYYFERPILLA